MPKKQITDENGKKFTVVEQLPWYKRKVVWISIAGALILIFTLINVYSTHTTGEASNQDSSATASSASSSDESQTSSSAKEQDSKSSTTTGKLSDDTTYTLVDSKKYLPKITDTSWKSGSLSIKNVYITKTKPFKYSDGEGSKTINGMVVLSYSYKSGEDVQLFDGQSKLSTNDGQQVDIDSSDSKDISDIDKGVTKQGEAVFLLENMSDVKKINNIRWRFDASPQNDDDDDILHSFDFQIPLKS